MAYLLAMLVALLFTIGTYLLLRPHLMKFAIGLVFLTNATNLLIFASGRLSRNSPPIIGATETETLMTAANPLAQALILTAIVIGLGFLAFTMGLFYKIVLSLGSAETEEMHPPQKEAA